MNPADPHRQHLEGPIGDADFAPLLQYDGFRLFKSIPTDRINDESRCGVSAVKEERDKLNRAIVALSGSASSSGGSRCKLSAEARERNCRVYSCRTASVYPQWSTVEARRRPTLRNRALGETLSRCRWRPKYLGEARRTLIALRSFRRCGTASRALAGLEFRSMNALPPCIRQRLSSWRTSSRGETRACRCSKPDNQTCQFDQRLKALFMGSITLPFSFTKARVAEVSATAK